MLKMILGALLSQLRGALALDAQISLAFLHSPRVADTDTYQRDGGADDERGIHRAEATPAGGQETPVRTRPRSKIDEVITTRRRPTVFSPNTGSDGEG